MDVKKIYLLEHLVMNDGDEQQIKALRTELGFTIEGIEEQKPKWNFTVEEYIKLRARGLEEKDIRKIHNISNATLARYKKRAGLTKEIVKELLQQYKKSS
ncbi:hypothetical protein MTP04_02420 [Lysinibacillus sp. PLM2]|nr:hypothetical protein MTP04_02420 [Lysinibacillus sp. PLM2]